MASTEKSRRLRSILAGAAALATAVALAACTPGTDNGGGGNDQPTQGGSVTIVSAGPVQSWDPTAALQQTIPGLATGRFLAVYGALLYVDTQSAVVPHMAESLETEDFQNWTLTLKPGIEFSDGTPYNAEAVKFNWDRAAADTSATKGLASTITSEVVDDVTLKITLAAPNPVFDRDVAEQLQFIASPTALEEQGDDYTSPVGAGPFLLESWDPAVGETMSRNPNYFREGRPYLDELNFTVIADPAQRVTTVAQGGADIMNNYRFALLEVLDQPGLDLFGVESGGLRMAVLNNATAPFSDIRAREAVALAINPDELTQTLTQDPDDGGWSGLFPESSDLYNSQYDIESNDPDAATALVEELSGEGIDTSITIVAAAVPELVRAGELLQIQLSAVGFDVQLEQVPLGDWSARVRVQKDFDITLYPGIFDLNNAPVSMNNLFTGTENIAQYSSDEMREAVTVAREATSASELVDAFATVAEIYQRDIPFIVFGLDERVYLYRDAVAGFSSIGRGMLLTEDLYRTDITED